MLDVPTGASSLDADTYRKFVCRASGCTCCKWWRTSAAALRLLREARHSAQVSLMLSTASGCVLQLAQGHVLQFTTVC